MVRPSRLVPFSLLMACSASSGAAISTNPKPRERPVSRSVTTLADSTAPHAANASRRRSLEVEKERPPTNNLTAIPRAPCACAFRLLCTTLNSEGDRGRGLTGRKVPGEPTTAPDMVEYTLSPRNGGSNLPRGARGGSPHRASAVCRSIPDPLWGRSRPSGAGGGAGRARGPPLARTDLQVVARAPGVRGRGALRRRCSLLARPPLGRAGARLAARPLRAPARARGAASRGVSSARCEDHLRCPARDGAARGRVSDGRHCPHPLLEVPRCGRGRGVPRPARELRPRLRVRRPRAERPGRRAPRGALAGAHRRRRRRRVAGGAGVPQGPARVSAIVGVETVVTSGERKPWHAIFRLLERDERVFAVLLAVAMVGGLATLGLVPLRPRQSIDLISLVIWFALYKLGIFALVTVHPRRTRAIFLAALGIDLLLVFVLLLLTGGGGSLFYLLFFPLVTVNAYYFGPWVALAAALMAGGLMAAAATLAPPWIGWTGVTLLTVLFGMPAVVVGIVAVRERGARGEVERLNAELTGTLNRLQAGQQELLVAERMATVGRLSLKVAHEVRNPIAAIELNAELLQDIVRAHPGADMDEATGLVAAIRDQVNTLDARSEEHTSELQSPMYLVCRLLL